MPTGLQPIPPEVRPDGMSIAVTAAAVSRRRFLLVAAVAAAGGLASLPGCAATPAADPDSGPGTPGRSRSSSAEGSSAAAAAPQALRGSGARRKPGDPVAARDALAGFGADFLQRARALDPTAANTAISPYSLFTVLAMARAGANGDTAAQIDAALRANGVAAQGAAISAVDAGIRAALESSETAAGNTDRKDEQLVIEAANQAWVQRDFEVHQPYLDTLAVQYGIEAMSADFVTDPEKMRLGINSWVADRTHRLIEDLFPENAIDDLTRLVLVNALYLKGAWGQPFSPAQPAPFFTGAKQVQAQMMTGFETFHGAVGNGWTAVSIPYLGDAARMTLLVPGKGGFEAMTTSLDAATIAAAGARSATVSLTMPKFAVSSGFDAKKIAQQLGIQDIFDTRSDLSGIAGPPGYLYAQSFVHRTVVKVDENGTEAAAATGMAIGAGSGVAGPIVQLTVDRPFLFWISEQTTGAPLFLGAVTDPTA